MKIATQPGVNPLDTLRAHTENIAAQTRAQSRQQRAAFRDTRLRHSIFHPVSEGNFQIAGGASDPWATLQGATSANFDDTPSTAWELIVQSTTTTDEWATIFRAAIYFDLMSVLRAESVIHSAVLKIRPRQLINQYSGSMVTCAAPTPDTLGTNPPPGSGDVDEFGTVEFADRVALSDITVHERLAVELNKAGRDNFSITAPTGFGFLLSHDFDNAEPTWASNEQDYLTFYSDYDSRYAPYLELEWYF